MNKTQIIEAMALEASMSKSDAKKALDAYLQITLQALNQGERITIPGFGSFTVQQNLPRVGRNPRTGAPVKIPARKVIKFRPLAEIE